MQYNSYSLDLPPGPRMLACSLRNTLWNASIGASTSHSIHGTAICLPGIHHRNQPNVITIPYMTIPGWVMGMYRFIAPYPLWKSLPPSPGVSSPLWSHPLRKRQARDPNGCVGKGVSGCQGCYCWWFRKALGCPITSFMVVLSFSWVLSIVILVFFGASVNPVDGEKGIRRESHLLDVYKARRKSW